jgi:hypothetical protein
LLAERFPRACKGLAALRADTTLGLLWPVEPSLAGLRAGSLLALAADAGFASTCDPSERRGCAWPDAGDLAARVV